ncbi:type IA DNA topoisomerase [Streptococcus agalactiae]|uniref:type IA DNA topoisomerase n=1 Tax=Streptococcus agalactiae TaxID=1311 RepID=UPI000F5F9E17|nr:DNA topoisomerase [Streptococcus agalactiae]MCC9673665.1 type IA DNA topoisomerase [Streptococcus agalactiae]MCC9745346.1 type IA DNA topoisomerase [Streptococcus agalactiae]RRA58889.1 type IA DNA topoisomerase [Streptococcus agalactiae]RRB09499.1 type IA DNA topoisomerase [Streptococcus agalactiae]HEO7869865.1 type IA DNA topoisomerase [Streptococcus agalactiae]
MVTVILAEKETQAAAYAESLGPASKKGKVHIIKHTPYFSDEVHVIAAEGHLFEYGLPKDNWDLDKLPLVDVSFKQTLKQDKVSKEIFKQIYQEVTAADQVIIGTDSDREGERIAYSILSHIPEGRNKVTERLWVNSLTTRALQKAFQNLREPIETYNYYLEAEARAQSDWLVGMNLSPLVTLELQKRGRLPKGNSLSVGRVQTPGVRLICENDLAIQNFRPETYWKLQLQDKETEISFSNKEKYSDSELILAQARQLKAISIVSSVEMEEKQRAAPHLFNLSDIQGLAAKQWGFEPTKTENLIESLYLKKYLSYPRTDTRFITEEEFDYLKNYLKSYQEVINCSFEAVNLEPRENYVNPEKVAKTSHYALIPTENIPNLVTLKPDERLIYEAVVRRTLLMFAADCRYSTTTVEVENQGLVFKTTGRQMFDPGWAAFSQQKLKGDIELPDYRVGDQIETKVIIVEGMTKPPKRITESQLISDILPKYGLGTQATRATMLQTIQDRGYITKDKKTGQLFPTNKAYLLIHYLYDNEFASPETTGGWELFLSQIGEGEINPREFVDAIKEKLAAQIAVVKERSD